MDKNSKLIIMAVCYVTACSSYMAKATNEGGYGDYEYNTVRSETMMELDKLQSMSMELAEKRKVQQAKLLDFKHRLLAQNAAPSDDEQDVLDCLEWEFDLLYRQYMDLQREIEFAEK